MKNIYIMIGLPGSGKSTFAKNYQSLTSGVKIVSSDEIREEITGSRKDQSKNDAVFGVLHKKIKEFLTKEEDNISLIVDATNLKRKYRKQYFNFSSRANIKAFYLSASFEDCLYRNFDREHKVPYEVMKRMYLGMNIPEWSEGWDDIIVLGERSGIQFPDVSLKLYSEKEIFQYPIFSDIFNVDQGTPAHDFTISNHSWRVYKYLYENFQHLNDREFKILCFAGLLHDVGKGFCKAWNEEKQRYTMYQHENVSAQKAIWMLIRTLPPGALLSVGILISNHILVWQNKKLATKRVGDGLSSLLLALNEADLACKKETNNV